GVVEAPEIKDRLGSSDVGNVSHVIPAIQPLMKIAPDGTPIHSRAFAAAARSPLAREDTLTASKAMAMTTLDLLADASLVQQAQAWLTEFLAKHGARVERAVGGLSTAFRATIDGAGPGPTIAIMAEYDALPGIGHACGHNVIATAGTGAGVALAVALGTLPV